MNNLKKIAILMSAVIPICDAAAQSRYNSVGLEMVEIPAGEFLMGSSGYGRNYDEEPVHVVSVDGFRMSSTEVTNAQYELFDPSHRALRGKNNFSAADDEAVVYLSWNDAMAFCKWLSEKEGKNYRLPTEAEWEYACRAGSMGPYAIGDRSLPKSFHKNQNVAWEPKAVALNVGKTEANAWGLYDMHGNVEEWCMDWYGMYSAGKQTNPVGAASGDSRVTRGGSHNTPVEYLRSSNRSSAIPEDRSAFIGFRIVEAEMPAAVMENAGKLQRPGKLKTAKWKVRSEPFFTGPVPFVKYDRNTVGMFEHNHCPAVTWLGDGSLLAVWMSTVDERDREMTVMCSRLDAGAKEWSDAELFYKVADRNMTGSALYYDDVDGVLYHFNGVEAAGTWRNLALVCRISRDYGRSWSGPVFVNPEHETGNQVIAGTIRTGDGWLIQPCDATPAVRGGSVLHISKDGGRTWERSDKGFETKVPVFKEGASGHRIAGIHAAVVELENGELLAFGRDDNIVKGGKAYMPASISKDGGRTWTYYPTEFPPVSSGQRLILKRLNEGPLMLVSFTDAKIDHKNLKGMKFGAGNGGFVGYGMYVALSFDDGRTWPVKKLLTDGKERYLNGGAFTGWFKMDGTHAEPKGYLAVTQSPDNVIHLCSSALYYSFNLNWIITQNK